ncbi:hypothetical protein BD847_1966 [Flavobacterium cutihirudinis]|uniref:Uncharacterized protein n=1 Tax=Flavobacterium cutihirudinis TaxID=1265740 RepID=A0A3D9FWT2_9FLAO|nr:hypothetical protein [Flavobacterium cutihirudinis]RED25221.1 hypothetical protein BD847_1966 [Flavobacterium cutihirudinis]
MSKNLLIIDNEDLTETISDIEKLSKPKGISINCFPLYVGLPDGNDVIDENGEIDMKLVLNKFNAKYGTIRFHMVASDFKLNDKNIDGVEIIRQFNNINNTRKANKILYSSELIEIVQEYLDSYKEKSDFDKSWTSFKTLIKLSIVDFSKREDIEKNIVNFIEKVSEQEDDFIVEYLLENKDLYFNPAIEIYNELSFNEIAEKISLNDPSSLNFKKKLIELAISHFGYLKK